MTRADLVKRLRAEGDSALRKHLSMGMAKLCAEAADALETCERKCAEQAHEINTMKLVIRKMEERRR